jgi:hypothetical protein
MAPDKPIKSDSRREEVDLETQFILRMPEEYSAKVEKEKLQFLSEIMKYFNFSFVRRSDPEHKTSKNGLRSRWRTT